MAEVAAPTVLIVGATGKQGGAVLRALLSYPNPPEILALTRKPSSTAARALLAAYPDKIQLIHGDTAKPWPIFAAYPRHAISAIFLMTNPPHEGHKAFAFIDAAAEHGVGHIVFSSV